MVLVVEGVMVLMAQSADAIPPFARKYRTSCSTCHTAIFKRNAFGEAFRRNGYRMPVDDELAIKEEPVPLGAPSWKKVWPKSIWPGSIPGTVPIGFYSHMRFTVTEEREGKEVVNTQFDAPHELELLMGGVFGDNLSFLVEWLVYEKGHVDEARLGSLYIQYDDLFGFEDTLNVKIGKFDPGGLDGYNAFKENNRLTLAHYRQNDYRVVPSSDKINGEKINYRWRYRDRQAGVEANGILMDRIEYAVGIVNGNGSTEETNDAKDWYYSLRAKLFGSTMTGKEESGTLRISDNWRDDSITIGTHAYFGKTGLKTDSLSWRNEFERFGADIRAKYGRFELGAAYIWGTDDDPGGPRSPTLAHNIDSSSWMVEFGYIPYPWLFATVRYEEVHFDKDWATDVENVVLSLSALQMANVRWTMEYFHHFDNNDGADTFKINLLFAF